MIRATTASGKSEAMPAPLKLPVFVIYRFYPPSYNLPTHTAMFVSQWAHQFFLKDYLTYDEYIWIQKLAYRICDKGQVHEPSATA